MRRATLTCRWLGIAVFSVVGTTTHSAVAAADTQSDAATHRLVAHADWTHPAEGYRLHVTPTNAGRHHASGVPGKTLSQAISEAGRVPFTMTSSIHRSLRNQLKCHAVFASDKPHWNLEAWRPDVGYRQTVAAFCNP